MIFATARLRELSALQADAPLADVAASAPVKTWLQTLLNLLAATAPGSATRLARAIIFTAPPSIDKGEVTDKGSINQRAVLKHRDALVNALHDGSAPNIAKPGAATA